jgi:hypothetical protein
MLASDPCLERLTHSRLKTNLKRHQPPKEGKWCLGSFDYILGSAGPGEPHGYLAINIMQKMERRLAGQHFLLEQSKLICFLFGYQHKIVGK